MIDLVNSENYIRAHRRETIETMLKFATTDLLLFWSDNKKIYARQQKIWQPFLNDYQKKYSVEIKISLKRTVYFMFKKRVGKFVR